MREQGCRMFACPPQWQWPLHICEPHLTEELAQGQEGEGEKELSLNKEGERGQKVARLPVSTLILSPYVTPIPQLLYALKYNYYQ